MSGFAEQLKVNRSKKNFSMQILADRARVSKSMISKIERREVQPTLEVAMRLANALDLRMSDMLIEDQAPNAILTTAAEQVVSQDAQTGFERRVLTPVGKGTSLDWLMIKLPGQTDLGNVTTLPRGSEKHIFVISGSLVVTVDAEEFVVNAGDTLSFKANVEHSITNTARKSAEFFTVVSED